MGWASLVTSYPGSAESLVRIPGITEADKTVRAPRGYRYKFATNGDDIFRVFSVFRGQKTVAQSPESASMASASLLRWASMRRGSLVKVVMVDVISEGTIKSS